MRRTGIGFGFLFMATLAAAALTACGSISTNDQDNGTGASNTGGSSSSGTAGGNTSSGNTGGDGGMTLTNTAGQGGGVEGCNPQTFKLQQAPAPEVYMVIDRSGSMNDPGATQGKTKWEELLGAVDAALTQFEAQIKFGVLLYPTGEECNTEGPQVAFAEKNRAAIMAALNGTKPAGGTPTAAALNNAAASLKALGSAEAPKFLVLATDGGPNCNYFLSTQPACSCNYSKPEYCCTNYPQKCYFGQTCLDDAGALKVIKGLHDSEAIDTFVIGLAGTDWYVDLLNQMALDGGKPQQGGNTDYYAVTDQTSLQTALQTIAVSVISCQIELEAPPQYPDKVSVYIDGQLISHDKTKTNGWDYTDDTHTTIELYGVACDKLQNGKEHNVTATFECEVT